MIIEGRECWQQIRSITAYPYGWQYPAITEQHAYERICEAFPDVPGIMYVGFPWATLIDFLQTGQHDKAQPYIDALKKIPLNNASFKITVAQHIYTARYIELFECVGITDIFWSHASNDIDTINNIRIHPFPLYPVRCLDGVGQTIKPLRSRKYLYSFVGAYDPQHYISPVRYWLSKLPQNNDGLVRVSKEWHFKSAVYDTQILDNAVPPDKLTQLERDAEEYCSLLKDTVFSLCPSGSGPNSIRLWESLGFGCIPVIIADTLKLPGDMSEWQEAAVFVREEEELIFKMPSMLRKISSNIVSLQEMIEAGRRLFEKYGDNNFIYDILQFSESICQNCSSTASRLALSEHIKFSLSHKINHATPKISIVTPSFNQAEFLEECIDSILSQNYPNLEYIIMDGGSTDGSVEIIKKYEKYLAYWQSKPDGGQYAAINEGFRRSTGEIMAWLNSDDKYHPGALWLVSEIFKSPDIEWIMGTPTVWGLSGALNSVVHPPPRWSREHYLRGEIGPPHIQQESTFWRRGLWERAGGKIDCTLEYAADMELWSRFFRCSQLHSVDAMLGGFRSQPSQKTALHMDRYNAEAADVIERERRIFLSAQDQPLFAAPPVVDLEDVASRTGGRPTHDNFGFFTYSRTTHFPFLRGLDWDLCDRPPDPKLCDLKVYQDLLVLSFIRQNIPPGSRVLEIGGGDSRVLRVLNGNYECWNLDKLEGLGNGPVKVSSENFRLVRDYIGAFCLEVPSGYFDFVFSISALEHVEENEDNFRNILKDIDRVLKPGGSTLHCFDVVARENNVWTNALLPYIFEHVPTLNRFIPFQQVFLDPHTYVMSQIAYESMWRPITNVPYQQFGFPLSYNVLWLKEELSGNDGHRVTKMPTKKQYPVPGAGTCGTKRSPLFSIIIPTHNSSSVIKNAIASVIRQTLTDFEIIVVDNLSTDNTIEILKSYNDERIKIFSEEDKGIYDAMNKGIKRANGKWLYFMGSDDVLFDNSTLYAVSHHLKINNFYYGNVKVSGNAGWAPDAAIYDGEFSLQKLLQKNICHQSIFYDRDVILKNAIEYKLEYTVCADWDFNLKCWSISPFTYIPVIVATFNAGGVSTKNVFDMFGNNLLYHLKDYFKINSLSELKKVLPKEKLHLLSSYNVIDASSLTRLIAFHLPQFHAIPENDEWWGKGFTEWTNVKKAQPLFDSHYQPHVPSDLGYYDLSKPSALEAQAALAQEYGIHGFCFYHYWFNGKLLLETPLHQMLKSGEPDFPFCLCWANEDWTRAWDGRSGEVLVGQKYSDADDIRHIHYLLNFFEDKRYIKIDDKPLFLVYRANKIPDARRTTDTWRSVARKLGIGELYLCRVESFPEEHSDPTLLGFDAAIEFQPDWQGLPNKLSDPAFGSHSVYDYATVVDNMIQKPPAAYKRFPCVVPSWDNSPRRKTDAVIFLDSSPTLYKRWLQHAIKTAQKLHAAEQLVFINAWNEWGEGNHLEPDQKFGTSYLEATRSVLQPDNDVPAAVLLSFETLDEFEKSAADFSLLCEQRIAVERSFITSGFPLNIRGRCYVCDTDVEYSIDSKGAYQMPWGEMPHWRERAICPRCGLNGRMRSFVQLLEQLVSPKSDAAIYISEQMTKLYRVLLGRYPHLVGSEYREGLVSGQVGQVGIRNESLTNLSFASESFDVVLSTDVLEHVYDIDLALRECLRVLRPGGTLLFTVPFSAERKVNVLRACQHKDGTIEHILPASYHGDPVRAEGSLTFHQFGWQLLDQIKDAGFSEVTVYNAWEPENIYLGPYNWFFKAMKPINKSISLATSGRNLCDCKVSIIIPVFNKVEYTKQCIHAIIRNTPAQLFEIIIIDNASTDDTKSYLQGLSGDVGIITNEQNVGYTIACNQGAAVAQGKYLVLLNNDTVPQPGWLESLIKLTEERPDAGAVGAKLVYPNGMLQEAGGIVFQDGSGWNFGNGDDPNKPVYNVVSDVDYCSGACLLVKKELFDQVGGFDEQYAPAYYEETDLCFSLREKGYKTLYNPDALVIHHESVTAGLDLKSSFRKYIEINKVRFRNKWCNDLKKHEIHPSVSGVSPFTADRSRLGK